MSNYCRTILTTGGRRLRRAGGGLSLVLLFAVPMTVAAESTATANLDAVIVSGDWLDTADDKQEKTYPGSRTVVDAEDLHERGALNLEDALRSAPGIQVLDETGTGILPNIGIRGLNPLRSERLQILVDGYPIAIGPYSNVGVSLFPVTLDSLQTADVVRGGAAVHYGPNNVGGVLNLTTRPIPFEARSTLRQRVTIAEESGNTLSDTYFRSGGYVNDKLALQVQANVKRGDGFREHSDTEVNNVILDANYFLNDKHAFKTQLQYYDVNAELPGALSPRAYREDRTQSQRPYDAYDADMARGTFEWIYTPGNDIEFSWRNFAHDADRTFYFGQNLGASTHWADPSVPSAQVADSPRTYKVVGTEPRLTMRRGNHTVIVGTRYLSEDAQFDVNRRDLSSGAYAQVRDWSLDTEAVAVYVSDSVSLAGGKLKVTPGLRYEDVRMDFSDGIADKKVDNHPTELLPGLTVGYQASERAFLFANGQRSLVPVQIAQVSRGGDVANETAWNYEVGGRFDVTPRLTSTVTLFRIDYEDQIQFNSNASRFENLGETRHQGIELSNEWRAGTDLTLGLGYTYLDTEQRNGENAGNDLPNAPNHHVSAEVVYDHRPWTASLTGNYFSESFSDAANAEEETANGGAGELPSQVRVNARLGRDFPLSKERNLNLALSVHNLFDEDHYFRGVDVSPVGRIPTPGPAYMLAARFDF